MRLAFATDSQCWIIVQSARHLSAIGLTLKGVFFILVIKVKLEARPLNPAVFKMGNASIALVQGAIKKLFFLTVLPYS